MPDVTPELEQAKARAEERLLGLRGSVRSGHWLQGGRGEPTDQLAIRVLVQEKKAAGGGAGEERIPMRSRGTRPM